MEGEEKTYYERNKEAIKKQRQGFYKKNQMLMRYKNKEWYKNNREYHQRQDVKQKRKEYRHSPGVLKRRRKYQVNKRKNNPAFAMQLRLRNLLWGAIRRSFKTGKTTSCRKYEININAVIEHLKPLPINLSDYEVHHIKPLFTFDFNNPDEIKKAFAPENHKILLIEEHRKINHFSSNLPTFLGNKSKTTHL